MRAVLLTLLCSFVGCATPDRVTDSRQPGGTVLGLNPFVHHTFTGRIDVVENDKGLLPPSVVVGSTITGTLTYMKWQSDSSAGPYVGVYWFPDVAPLGIDCSVAGGAVQFQAAGPAWLQIVVNFPPSKKYAWSALQRTPEAGFGGSYGIYSILMGLEHEDDDGTALGNDALLGLADTTGWEKRTFFIHGERLDTGGTNEWTLRGTITHWDTSPYEILTIDLED